MKRERAIPVLAVLFATIASMPVVVWIHVFEKKTLSQSERVSEFTRYFPPMLRNLSTISTVEILCAAAGLALGIAAFRRPGWSRALGLTASIVSAVLLALSVFRLL